MSYDFKNLLTELSAINAGDALLERSIQQETNLPLEPEKPKFKVSDYTETKLVGLSEELAKDGCVFFEFDAARKPRKLRHIISIELSKPESRYYYVVVDCFATPEDINKELETLILHF